IANTEFEKILKKLAVIRSPETWNLFLSNPSFRSCTSGQKTWLESIFRDYGEIDCGTIIEQGSPIQSIYIIRSGEVDLQEDGKVIHTLTKGCFVGEIEKLYEDNISSFSYTVKNPTELFEIKADDMKYFLDKNPGLIMKLKYNFMRQRP
ncbi:MAG TPA: cyclic nucleotide-binding domain-containing protein, partial [Spirochaetota bacterium]|nr:cyclic nucleotide-binding domain-containing protein [Spirochaetota bacterium]